MRIPSFGKISASVFLMAVAVSACTVEPGPGPGPIGPGPGPGRPGPEFCTREYAPVCGQRRGDRQTFPNGCEADRAGYNIAYPGECRGNSGGGGGWDRPRPPRPGPGGPGTRPPRPEPGPQMCTQQYAPVCARRGGTQRTFGNSCEAQAAGFRVIYEDRC
ncbi:Kazal-type serine protease inhibitor domain-containing protein [Mesorhizobium sp. SB112]|uniref:Kazal-type serine protease inhibitor domain-containing protein n=1 Tax=Mesorhizobium sp. SB112 TaxID=3151853 RepID=UPI003264E021